MQSDLSCNLSRVCDVKVRNGREKCVHDCTCALNTNNAVFQIYHYHQQRNVCIYLLGDAHECMVHLSSASYSFIACYLFHFAKNHFIQTRVKNHMKCCTWECRRETISDTQVVNHLALCMTVMFACILQPRWWGC